jgi:hypothetical protein
MRIASLNKINSGTIPFIIVNYFNAVNQSGFWGMARLLKR